MTKVDRRQIRKELIRAVYGDFDEWRRACERARDAGWTLGEVDRILWIYHPWSFFVIYLPAALLVIALVAHFLK